MENILPRNEQLPYYTQGASNLNSSLKDGFCKNYIKLYINKGTKYLGEDQIK